MKSKISRAINHPNQRQNQSKFKGVGQECPTHTKISQSAVDVGGWIVEGDELPWGVVFCGERVFRIRVLYGQDLSAADSPENEILLVNGDNSVLLVEYRIVIHDYWMLKSPSATQTAVTDYLPICFVSILKTY